VTGFDQAGGGQFHEIGEVVTDAIHRGGDGGVPIPMSAAHGLGNNFIDQAEFEKILGGDAEGFGGLGGKGTIFPKNAGASFGRNDGVVGVFQNENAVGHPDAQGSTAAPFPNDDGDDGDMEIEHFANIDRDRLGHVALFTGDTGKCSRGVDEGDDGKAKAVGQAHQAKGFTVAFGVGAAEVAHEVLFGVATFLMAEKNDPLLIESGETADEGAVFPKGAITAQLKKFGGSLAEVIEQVGALGVTNNLDALPRGKVPVNLFSGDRPLFLQGADFQLGAQLLFAGELAEFVDSFLEFG